MADCWDIVRLAFVSAKAFFSGSFTNRPFGYLKFFGSLVRPYMNSHLL
ncbi:MAG: hypothetical protein HC908_11920 [Calothrix sp. SM1_7_51]|nr:hypothetical protein [Calothrix sp. SM1_7_51]